MTIKEFYEWAVKNGVENFKMFNDSCYGVDEYSTKDWRIEIGNRLYEDGVYTDFEC